MSIQTNSFYYYIMTYDTPINIRFRNHFKTTLHNIPKEIVSSRQLIKLLEIKTGRDLKVFRDSFMDYFTEYFKHA